MIGGKKIGFALGGGGARGISHVGIIKTLNQAGIKADVIAGTSMGAIVSALYALGHDWSKVEEEILSFNSKKIAKELIDMGRVGQSFLKGKKIRHYLESVIGDKQFGDTLIPLKIIACDLSNGQEVALSKGSIVDAIVASMSVPGIFPPVMIKENIYIDGGVVNPTPIDVVKDMGADIILGVDLIVTEKRNIREIPNMANTLLYSYDIIRRLAVEQKLKDIGDDVLIIKPELRQLIDSFKFLDVEKFLKSGEKTMQKAMPELKKMIGLD